MITVTQVLKKIILKNAFLEEGIARGIINLSALARQLQPVIQQELKKPIKESAVLVALKRMTPFISQVAKPPPKILKSPGDLVIRFGISQYTYELSPTLFKGLMKFLNILENQKDKFIAFTQGVKEMTIIINNEMEETIEKIFAKEKLLIKLTDLAALVMYHNVELIDVPGIHYAILKQLAWEHISVIEEITTYNEYSIILRSEEVDRAFTVLRNLW